MRKDLKLGLGIGGLMLLALVVFFVARAQSQSDAENRLAEQSDQEIVDPSGETPAPSADQNPPTLVTPGPTGPSITPMPPFASGPTHPPATPDPFDRGSTAAAPSGGQDWDLILATGRIDNNASRGVGASARASGNIAPPPPITTPRPPALLNTTPIRTEAPAPPTPGVGGTISAATGRPYTIKEGDTFSSIAKAAYGSSRFYLQIIKANPNVNPNKMKLGQQIILPDLSADVRAARPAVAAPFSEADNRPVRSSTEYRVDSGDSLYRISTKLYGSHKYVDQIYILNKAAIGPNPEKLKFGMILKLPLTPASASN